jgi:hypothetical protein
VSAVRAVVVLALLLLVSACTITGDEAPPADPAAPAPSSVLPPRPRDVRIDGVDPCSLLTEAQRAELGLDARPRLDVGPLPPYPGRGIPLCLFGGFTPRAVSVAVSVVTTAGVEIFTSGELVAELQTVRVAGFPAAVARPTRNGDFCTVIVDVAPGQTLDVNFRSSDPQPAASQQQLCAAAGRAAEAAMSTLLQLH